MNTKSLTLLFAAVVAVVGTAAPAFAETAAAGSGATSFYTWATITAGFAMAFASGLAALAQGKACVAALEGIARQPGAAGPIQTNLILGLALIESLAIYVLVIALIIFFVNPFAALV